MTFKKSSCEIPRNVPARSQPLPPFPNDLGHVVDEGEEVDLVEVAHKMHALVMLVRSFDLCNKLIRLLFEKRVPCLCLT